MPFEIIWSDSAVRQLRRLDRGFARRIFEKVSELSENPFRWVRRMNDVGAYQLRVGGYRGLLDIDEGRLRVLAVEVGHRDSVDE